MQSFEFLLNTYLQISETFFTYYDWVFLFTYFNPKLFFYIFPLRMCLPQTEIGNIDIRLFLLSSFFSSDAHNTNKLLHHLA